MRIGLDLHGVIDRFPHEFALITRRWVDICGHEVHIVTGEGWATAERQMDGFRYTHRFSIVDHHRAIGTKMELKESGWWMPQDEWDRTKGDYAQRVGLSVHFEDTLRYAPWFPPSCTFIHVGRNFGEAMGVVGDFLNAFDLLRGNV
jgi:hypothetical protein